MSSTSDAFVLLAEQKESLRQIANRYLDSTDRLPVNCTVQDIIDVLNEYDEYSYMNALLNSIEVFPDKTYSINDTEGHIKGLRQYAFYYNTALKSVNLPAVEVLQNSVFTGCTNIVELLLNGVVEILVQGAFNGLTNLKKLQLRQLVALNRNITFTGLPILENLALPSVQSCTAQSLFTNSNNLKTLLFNKISSTLTNQNFANSSSVEALVLCKNSDLITLSSVNYLNYTNMYVYVPLSLQSSYQQETNWSVIHQAKTDEQGNYNGIQAIEPNLEYLRNKGVDFSITPYANKRWDGLALVDDPTIGEEVDE